jgi:hypothetical protein
MFQNGNIMFERYFLFCTFHRISRLTLKNGVFWDVCRVALVRTDVSEELSAPFIRVTRIGELGTMLAVTKKKYSISSQHASVASYS